MLGRLARWLRTLGYDTAYDDAIADAELVRRAFEEGRHVLTRDRRLFREWRFDGGLLLHADGTLDQLTEVVEAFQLPAPTRLFRRCRECNGVLAAAGEEAISTRVPARVRERARHFSECPECGRVYWEGSHTARMRSVLEQVFGSPAPAPPVPASVRRAR
jgi:uncharacterized protein with PIN domain